jgi:molybdenum cofactor cytidylyltransferase
MMDSSGDGVYAIVPAAGRSRRMGRPKQLLDVSGRPLLLGLVDVIAASRVASVVIVTRRAIAAALGLQDAPLAFVEFNEEDSSEMIDSVRLGLRRLGREPAAAGAAGYLVCPGDHAELSTADVDACVEAFRAATDRIVIAARDGRAGHPIIFPAALAGFVESPSCDPGLRALRREFPQRVAMVECRSPGVLRDIDTPRDYDDGG